MARKVSDFRAPDHASPYRHARIVVTSDGNVYRWQGMARDSTTADELACAAVERHTGAAIWDKSAAFPLSSPATAPDGIWRMTDD